MTLNFQVNDMTCGHCGAAITQAVQAVDAQARVRIDLPAHLVQIEPGQADALTLGAAITEAGFTPVLGADPSAAAAAADLQPGSAR